LSPDPFRLRKCFALSVTACYERRIETVPANFVVE